LQIKFFGVTVLVLIYFCDQFVASEITTDVTAAFVNNQHGIQRRGQDFDMLRFDKVTESLKVGPFLRHSVDSSTGSTLAQV